MTCIKFFIGFSGRSTTTADLFSRLHYLHTARRHFQVSAMETETRVLVIAEFKLRVFFADGSRGEAAIIGATGREGQGPPASV